MAKKPSNKDIIKAMKKFNGVKYQIANDLKCSRTSLDKWINEDEELLEAFTDIDNKAGDDLEAKAFDIAMEGSEGMLKFMLSRKYKNRGYTETVETKDVSEKPREIIVSDSDAMIELEKLRNRS